ncbi:unnamed protein product, partial [Allacma fusca]
MEMLFIYYLLVLCTIIQTSFGKHPRKEELQPKNATRLSKEVYQKLYSVMSHSRAFRNYTLEQAVDFINEMDSWRPPEDLANRFPYYLGGYDDENRPIWYAEVGKYRFDDLIDRSTELFPVFEKMFFRLAINVAKSFVARDKP